jgi:hypothetical protein
MNEIPGTFSESQRKKSEVINKILEKKKLF